MSVDNRTELDKRQQKNAVAARARSAAISALSSGGGDGIDLVDSEFIPVSVNELEHLQKMNQSQPGQPQYDDPVAMGVGAWARPDGRRKYYIGKYRMDVLRWKDGERHHTECGFEKIAVDELVNGDNQPLPLYALYMTGDDEDSTDEAMQPVAIFSRRGIRFLVPVSMEAGSTEGPPAPVPPFAAPFNLRAPGGECELHCQGDGNAVMYDVRPGIIPPAGDPGPWVALSTLKDGKLRDFRPNGDYR